jgi:hypothetical protein
MFDRYAQATVKADNIVDGDVFTVDGKEYRATSDSEFVRSAGEWQIRAVDAYDRVTFVSLTESDYDVTYVTEYATA